MATERVQAVAETVSADTIPPEFIRSEADQPAITTFKGPIPDIPVVDLGQPDVVEAVAAASREWGFFQVVNHGVPEDLIKRLQSAGKEFYELPLEEKEKYAKEPGAPGIDGYGSRLQKELEGKKAWVDHLFHKIWPPSAINYRYWPLNPPYYREVNEEYATYMRQVGDKLFSALSLGLGLKENALKEGMGGDDVQYNLKINFYPPCPCPELTLGVPPHTDLSGITILVPNEVQGLQVMKDDHWIDAKYIPNAFVIHIGDQIEILSNGRYKSVLHRTTVNKEKTRISWPVFLEPPPELVVGPLPEMVSDENPAKFKTKKFKDYMYCKLNKIPQ